MKRIITLFVLLTTTLIYSQSSGITYQAVLYNPSGEILPGNNNANAVLSNKDICLRFSITDSQTSLEYQETQRVTTDEFGMVNLVIGSGNQIGGYATNFNAIVWNSNTKKLQVAIDVAGSCSNFVEISNQNFSAVPFAYASKTAESVSGVVPIVNGGTGSSTVSGAKTNLGLNNVDNTSDVNKPISNATQTALTLKENAINKSTNTALGTSDVLFPTQNAVKTYVDNQLSSGVVDATSTIKGKITLAGDLTGTADLPIIANSAINSSKIANGAVTDTKITSVSSSKVIGSIPVSQINGAVSKVNGVLPNGDGSVVIPFGMVRTGTLALRPNVGTTTNGDIYVVSGDSNANNNGLTYISDGQNWNEVTPNQASLDARYLKLGGGTMSGNIIVPAGKFISINDVPTSSTDAANKAYVDSMITGGATPDATTISLGKIQLAGDLGGTATSPTVPGLASKEPTITSGTTSQYFRGDKTWQTLNKTVVGLGNIDNTSDVSKPISIDTQTALNAKENAIAVGTTAQYYRGDKTWQTLDKTAVGLNNVNDTSDASKPISTDTQAALDLKANLASPTFTGDAKAATAATGDNDTSIATTAFVNSAITNAATPNATTSSLGKIQLGGDLAGPSSSASVPVITNGAITTLKLADASVTNAKIGETIAVANGGTGATSLTGYLKGNGTSAFTSVSSIPVVDVDGAVRKVNGVVPDTDGNVAVIIGRVFTGATVDPNLATSIINASPAKKSSDIYVVADGSNPNNGRTFIYDGTTWLEVATNLSTTDARYVNVAGDTMEGNLTVPTGKKLILTDIPTNATDATNKTYVDTLVAGKQNPITLTTSGTGAASLVGATLNIPTPNNGTVTNVDALTISNLGTDITSTVANSTTTPVVTLNVPTASAANRGALSAADWTTFNDKVGGSGTATQVPFFNSSKNLTSAPELTYNNTTKNLTVGLLNDNTTRLTVNGAIKGNADGGALLLQDGANNQIFRGLWNFFGSPLVSTQYFQMGNNNVAFTGFNGGKLTRASFRTDGFQVSSQDDINIPAPTGIFEIRNPTSAVFNVLTTGNVGIGTTNPTQNLTIQRGLNIDNANANTGTITNALIFGASGSGEGISSPRSGTSNVFGLNFMTDGTLKMAISNAGNVGIGTATPANKLEITQGTAGNSGLRFTNLNSSSTAFTSASKVLGLNSTGDVILTNIPGTQNIVSFSTATPTTSGVVFTPNTSTDQSVIYQSATDNSLWTYNGTTYVTYTAPATTAWNLANTTNDAGSNKTSSIWRTGGIAIGGSSTSPMFGNITALGGTNFSGVPAFGTASLGLINNSTAGWSGSGFLFSNSTAGSNAFSMVYNNDKAYFGQLTPSNTITGFGTWSSTGLILGSNNNPFNRLDVVGGTAIGSYAGVNTAPSNGLIVSGNVGIGTSSPATTLHVNSNVTATSTINADAQVFRMMRPQNPGFKWENIAQFNLGSYANSINATSRLDLAMNDGSGITTSNVMTWQANGNVGIGTTAPISTLSNTATAIQGSNSTNAFTGGLTWSTPGTGFAASFYSQPTNGNGLQVKIAGNTSANNALEVSSGATQTGSLTPLFNVLGNGNVGIGTTAPSSLLHLVTSSSARMLFETTDGAAGQASIDLKAGSSQWWRIIGQGSTNGGRYDIWNQTSNSSAMSILPSNYIGIGTQSPTAQLEVATMNGLSALIRRGGATAQTPANLILQKTSGVNAGTHGAVVNGDYVGRILFSASNGSAYLTNGTDIVGYAAGNQSTTNNGGGIFFRTVPQNSVAQSVERMRIDENGNVGIGTTAPTTALDVKGNGLFRNGNSSIAYINDQILFGFMGTNNYQHSIKTRHNSSGLAGNAIDFFVWNQAVDASTGVGTKQVMTLDGNGNVGIGTTAPAAQLHTTGSVRFAGAGTPGAGKVLTSDASGNATWQNALGSTTVSSKTADYILASSDNAGFIVVNSATLVTITVPSTLSAGFYCQIIQQGTGQVSVVGDTGVSVTSAMGTKSRTTGSSIGVMLTTSTTAFLSGDTGF